MFVLFCSCNEMLTTEITNDWKKSTQITKPKSLTLYDKIAKILHNVKRQNYQTMQVQQPVFVHKDQHSVGHIQVWYAMRDRCNSLVSKSTRVP